jgi:lipopolysaccharide transport system permease protein
MGQAILKIDSIKILIGHRKLLWRVTNNDLKAQYAGSIFGVGWAVLTPLILLAIYTVVYLIIFQVRAPNLTPLEYVMHIFSGLVPFLMTSEALSNGAGSVVASKAVWSNTVFPIDLAPVKAVLMSQVSMIVGFSVIFLVLLYTQGLSWAVLLFPIIWGLHLLLLIGITWILSLINVVFRDIRNLIGLVLMALMIISPIAYTPEMVPAQLKILLFLNPMAYYVSAYQSIMVLRQAPVWWDGLFIIFSSLTVFFLGSYFFGRAKRALIDYV